MIREFPKDHVLGLFDASTRRDVPDEYEIFDVDPDGEWPSYVVFRHDGKLWLFAHDRYVRTADEAALASASVRCVEVMQDSHGWKVADG